MDWLIRGDYATEPVNLPLVALGLVMAFLLGQLVAWVYIFTHSGLSYSKSFVNSLIIIPIIVALVMNVLSNNLVTAFGMMAVFAIVRFRNILRDTLDTAYILAVIVVGMACGTQKFSSAMIGGGILLVVLVYLWFTSFGSRHRFDLILNLHWSRSLNDLVDLQQLLNRHSIKALCASQRSSEGYEGTDLSYRLLLRNPDRIQDLLSELRDLDGVSRVTSLKAEDESEV